MAGIADTTKPAFSAEQAAQGLFGQGKMVYNKYILGIKGRTIMYQKGIKRLLAVVLSASVSYTHLTLPTNSLV